MVIVFGIVDLASWVFAGNVFEEAADTMLVTLGTGVTGVVDGENCWAGLSGDVALTIVCGQ